MKKLDIQLDFLTDEELGCIVIEEVRYKLGFIELVIKNEETLKWFEQATEIFIKAQFKLKLKV